MTADASFNYRNNTLNLSAERLAILMDELDQMNDDATARRNHARLEYRKHSMAVEVFQPSGGSVVFCVACRNISRGGLSVLHSSYMHLGTKCRVKLRHKHQGDQWILATVAQCQHVTGRVHSVGMKFVREIEVNDYVRVDPLDESYSLERVDPEKLEGRVLLVSGSEIDKGLIEVYLSDTSIKLVHVPEYSDMVGRLSEPFHAVLCDFDSNPKAAYTGVQSLRESGHSLPVIAISSDLSESSRDAIRDSRASAFVPKPLKRYTLLRALAEFVLLKRAGDDADAARPTNHETDPSLKALAEIFSEDLQTFADELARCQKEDDQQTFRQICTRIRGTGPLLGHAAIADAANKAMAAVDSAGSLDPARELINTLISLCRHARSAA